MSADNASPSPSASPSLEEMSNAAGTGGGAAPAAVDSNALLQGARAIHIVHNGETYRLQTTRQGKLILTK